MINKKIIDLTFILTIFLIDRASKSIMINLENLYGIINYDLTSFINLELIWNNGIAFGLLSFNDDLYYNLITLVIVIITIVIFIFMLKSSSFEKYGFLMVFSGSLGNIFDRIYYSSVPDFIDIHINNFHWFIFNVADIFITVGVICLIYAEIFDNKREKKTT